MAKPLLLMSQSTRKITFHKAVGTGYGKNFTLFDANPWMWGLILVAPEEAAEEISNSFLVSIWRKISRKEDSYLLKTIASHGKWSNREPFEIDETLKNWPSEVVAITRARIKARHTLRFYLSVPPVSRTLHQSNGVISAWGIGEAPIGLQGTFSHWSDQRQLRDFAYQSEEHKKAIEDTEKIGWYSEELFARFAVISTQQKNFK